MQVVIILAQSILNSSAYVIISATSEARNDKNLFYVVSSTYVHRVLPCTSAGNSAYIVPETGKLDRWISESYEKYFFLY